MKIFASISTFLLLILLAALPAASPNSAAKADVEVRHYKANEVYDYRQPIIFDDDFHSGKFSKWRFSENDNYEILHENPDRIQIMDAPDLGTGRKAVRFSVQRAPNSFRSEISLPHEAGFQERWYGARIFVPHDWVFDDSRAVDIVIQWHAISGNWKPARPNLEISIGKKQWFIRQSFGSAQTKPTRTEKILDEPVQQGAWVSWVIHAKWSPDDDGILQIWKDGKQVLDRKGANVYSTIGVDYTPYLKTGIYHPEWHLTTPARQQAFAQEESDAFHKVICVTDVKIGDARAKFKDVAPKP